MRCINKRFPKVFFLLATSHYICKKILITYGIRFFFSLPSFLQRLLLFNFDNIAMFGVLRVGTRVFHLLNQLMVAEGWKCAFEKDEKDNFSTCVCVCFVTTQGLNECFIIHCSFPFIII